MGKLIVGAFFLLLDLSLKHEAGYVIDLLPDFLGYVVIFFGLREVDHWSKHFRRLQKLSLLFALYTFLYWGANAINLVIGMSFAGMISDLVTVVLRCICLYWIISGIDAVEQQTDYELRSSTLKLLWICLLVLSVMVVFAGFIPVVGAICSIAAAILAICFLIAFFRTKCYYDDAMDEIQQES